MHHKHGCLKGTRYLPLDRSRLPDPLTFYQDHGLTVFRGRGAWRRANCIFCGSRDNFNIHVKSGGFHCWSCPARGGDVVAFFMAQHGSNFRTALIALDYVEAGSALTDRTLPRRPTSLSARDAIHLLAHEANFVAITAANVKHGVQISEQDCNQLMQAARRINHISESYR